MTNFENAAATIAKASASDEYTDVSAGTTIYANIPLYTKEEITSTSTRHAFDTKDMSPLDSVVPRGDAIKRSNARSANRPQEIMQREDVLISDKHCGTTKKEVMCHDAPIDCKWRESGVLLHITSLPSPYGIGTMGDEARAFMDFLAASGQRIWQVLPLGMTGYGDSPYQSFSTRAGNPYLIDPLTLVREGLLVKEELDRLPFGNDPERVDYSLVSRNRPIMLRIAWTQFQQDSFASLKRAFSDFREAEEASWLREFACFMSIKSHYGGVSWHKWPEPLKRRDKDAIEAFMSEHHDNILFYEFIQFLFFRQWKALLDDAHERGIEIVGDLPIYVAYDSVEVWSQPHLFQLDEQLLPTFVAGCPPDAFSDDGQLWGNPLYKWDVLAEDDYRFWVDRIRFQLRLVDRLRIDHFRGLESYWSVPFGDRTARRGNWISGPAENLFEAIDRAIDLRAIFAEDLGFITPEVLALRDRFALPGMKVLQFAFNTEATSEHIPHNLDYHTVLYTGTHDNDTIRGWFENWNPKEVAFARKYLGINDEEGIVAGMMRGAATSVCRTVIYQMQDILELGNESRMNEPATISGNWQWRMLPGMLTKGRIRFLYDLTKMSSRLPEQQSRV